MENMRYVRINILPRDTDTGVADANAAAASFHACLHNAGSILEHSGILGVTS